MQDAGNFKLQIIAAIEFRKPDGQRAASAGA
jgi:hypothetical protein